MANKLIHSKDYIDKLEDYAELVYKHTKIYLPTLARLCLISTYIEDGLRMYFQWHEQREYMNLTWGCGVFIASVFVLINLFGQLGSCALILLQKKVNHACGMLVLIVILQVPVLHETALLTIAYNALWYIQFLFKNLALLGGILLLLADSHAESRRVFAGVPSLGDNKPKNYLQLAGRCLIAFMFVTLIRFEFDFALILLDVLGSILMVLVTIGYKTKLSALILVIFLTAVNVYHNDWWNVGSDSALRDYLKYDFFQTLSVIGGLIMLVLRGPGGVSVDEHKKSW